MNWDHLLGALVVLGLIALAYGYQAWSPKWRPDPADEFVEGPTPVSLEQAHQQAELAALTEICEQLKAYRPRAVRKGVPVVIRLMSGSLQRELSRMTIREDQREPAMQVWVSQDQTLSTFVASHREEDAWVYRRVGVENVGRA